MKKNTSTLYNIIPPFICLSKFIVFLLHILLKFEVDTLMGEIINFNHLIYLQKHTSLYCIIIDDEYRKRWSEIDVVFIVTKRSKGFFD